jgi:hypothetical protein
MNWQKDKSTELFNRRNIKKLTFSFNPNFKICAFLWRVIFKWLEIKASGYEKFGKLLPTVGKDS